jgi:serine/threonine-protein kinase
MVHRDVKPGNILVCPDGHVKITDFGIAWSARSVALTRTGQVIGTPQYLSPEQAEGRLATPASDVYGLGLIGYECLTGRPAFEGDNPVTIALKQVRQNPEPLPAQLPSGVRALVTRALAKDPAARFVDGAAFVAAVEDVLAGRAVPSAPTTLSVDVPVAAVPLRAADDGRSTQVTGAGRRAPAPRRRAPAPRHRNRLAMVMLPLLGLLAGAGIAVALLQALTSRTPSSPAAAAEQRTSESIVLDAKDYLGRPVDEVAAQLSAFGLTVDRRAEEAPDAVPGMVTDVRPAGTDLSAGDTVAVYFAESGPDGSNSGSGGAGVTGAAVNVGGTPSGSESTSTASETSAAASSPQSSDTPSLSASPTTPSEPTETSTPEETTPSETTTASDTTSSTPTDTTTPASSAPSSAKK